METILMALDEVIRQAPGAARCGAIGQAGQRRGYPTRGHPCGAGRFDPGRASDFLTVDAATLREALLLRN